MNIYDWIIIIALAGAVALAVFLFVRSKRKGSSCCGSGSCCGSCESCGYAGSCSKAAASRKNKQ